eukprot:scaffold85740_cov66-Phaeocystis_antarctica.AAC.8
MVQDLTKGISVSRIREPKMGQLLLLLLRRSKRTGTLSTDLAPIVIPPHRPDDGRPHQPRAPSRAHAPRHVPTASAAPPCLPEPCSHHPQPRPLPLAPGLGIGDVSNPWWPTRGPPLQAPPRRGAHLSPLSHRLRLVATRGG